jgi:N-terminal acetyltransferase B complex catalytic subunit
MREKLPEGYVLERFLPMDIRLLGQVNVDYLSETYAAEYYLHYLIKFPTLCNVIHYRPPTTDEQPSLMGSIRSALSFNDSKERLAAYILGRSSYTELVVEGVGRRVRFGHVSALSVGPDHRRKGLASALMAQFEQECARLGCCYVDLFVRPSNEAAVRMYCDLGYVVYRRVMDYYGGDVPEDAFGIP